jgi:DNA-directed RNA polymerase specialized sigma24 family protein
MTYQEIAKALGVSHQAVWETERKALAKVKAKLEARGLTLEDFISALGGSHA